MAKNYEGILVDKKDGVATLTLNRPEKMNPLSPPLMGEIIEAMDEIAADPDVTVLVITGAGRAFTAGADLNWFGGPKKISGSSRRISQIPYVYLHRGEATYLPQNHDCSYQWLRFRLGFLASDVM